MFGLLGRFDDGSFVEVALVVDIELAEGILEPEDLRLLELGIFSARGTSVSPVRSSWTGVETGGLGLPLDLDDVHGGFKGGRRRGIVEVRKGDGVRTDIEVGMVSAWRKNGGAQPRGCALP